MDSFDYIQAAKGQALMTCTPEDRVESIRAAVDRAFNLKAIPKPSGVDYETIITEVEKKVANAYPYMTSQELAWITERGVAGELTRDTKPTASAIFGWMYAYMNDDLRKEAIRNYRRNGLRDSSTELSRAEKDELNRQAGIRGLRALWAEYKTHGRILEREHLRGYVASICDAALEFDLFDVTPESWRMAREEAQKERRRLLGNVFDRALPYSDEMLTKWCLLEMCFEGQRATGRDLIVNA